MVERHQQLIIQEGIRTNQRKPKVNQITKTYRILWNNTNKEDNTGKKKIHQTEKMYKKPREN